MLENVIKGIVILILCCLLYQVYLDVMRGDVPKPIKTIYDPDNGCQYVVNGGSVTPRLDPFGKQVCKHDN